MSIQIGTVVITKDPSFKTDWWPKRFNQFTIVTADAGRVTYDNGPDVVQGMLVIKNVAKSEGDSLRTFLTDTAVFGLNFFQLIPPPITDLGRGPGVLLNNVFFIGGTNLKGVLDLKPPSFYDVSLPYWFRV